MSLLAAGRRCGVIERVLDQLRDLINNECAKLFDEIGGLRGTPDSGICKSLRKSAEDVCRDVARELMDHVIYDLLSCPVARLEPEGRHTASADDRLKRVSSYLNIL